MVIQRLMKKINVNPVPKKVLKPSAKFSLPKYPTLTFGAPLKEIVERDKTDIPIVVTDIFNFLLNKGGLQSEGIFRVNGNSRTVEALRTIVDENGSYWHLGEFSSLVGDSDRSVDVFSVASLLKLYLRELPGGLIPENTTSLFLKVYSQYRFKQEAYLIQLENLIAQLPVSNYTLLKHLCQFLRRVSIYQTENKMSTESLGIVFGPNVFAFTPEDLGYREQNSINHIMSFLIEQSGQLFRMIAPSCENVKTLGNSSDSCSQIPRIPHSAANSLVADVPDDKKYKEKFGNEPSENLSDINSYNDDIDEDAEVVKTESSTKSTTMAARNRVSNTYCSTSRVDIMMSTTAGSTPSINGNDVLNDIQLKCKPSSTYDAISTYLEMAIRSCIEEHLFHEQLLDWKVSNTVEELNNTTVATHMNYTSKPTGWDTAMKKNDRLNNNTMFPVSEVRAAIKQIKSSSKQSDGYISTHKSIGDVVPISDQNDFSSGCGADKGNLFPHHRDVNIAKSVDCTTNNGANNMKMISSTLSFNQSSDKWPVYKDHDEVKVYMRELRSPGSGLASKPSLESNNMTENQNTSDQIGYNGSTVESTFLLLSNRLTEKRLTANRPEALHLMTPKQIEAEKLALQKALLYFENLHGRPRERQDRITMRPLYNRYRSVKRLLNSLQTNQNPNFIEHMNEENSDTEGHLSVPSNDDVVRRKSIQSPPIFSMNSEVIPTKCILSTGNSTSSFKSNIPVSYSSLQHSRLNNHSSSVVFYDNGSNNKRIPPMSSSSSALLSVSSNLPLYSSNISPQFNLGDCNHELNNAYIDDDDDDDFEVTQKQSISSTIKSSHRSDVNKLCNQVDGLLLSTEKQNVNNFSAKRQSATNTRLDSNGGLSKVHSTSDYETKYTNSGNSRIQNNNEWFGTIGLSRQIQPGGDHDYFMTTSHLQYKYPSENNQRTIHESLSPSAGATTPMKSIKHPNTNDEYCPPSQQNNLIASKLSCVTLPTLSSSSLSNLKINQTNSSDLIRTNISAAVAKHRRRILTTSDNAINTISTVDDKYIESSQAMSSSSAAAGETNLANWSTSDLKAELRSLRESKRQLQKTLKDFEHEFIQATGQKVERADRLCMRSEYCQYKALKTRLLQLEAELKGRCA